MNTPTPNTGFSMVAILTLPLHLNRCVLNSQHMRFKDGLISFTHEFKHCLLIYNLSDKCCDLVSVRTSLPSLLLQGCFPASCLENYFCLPGAFENSTACSVCPHPSYQRPRPSCVGYRPLWERPYLHF